MASKSTDKEKYVAKGGPFDGEFLWLSGDTLEFTTRKIRIKQDYQGYYKVGTAWTRTTREAKWVNTAPKVQPHFQFESRENINGFSNGL